MGKSGSLDVVIRAGNRTTITQSLAIYVNDRGILAQNGVSRRKILYPSDLVVELVILEAPLLLEWFSVHWEQTSLLSI